MSIRALSVRQPHANLIRDGVKVIEVRSWSTDYRGELVIVAGKQADVALAEVIDVPAHPRGVTLCLVELHDVRPLRRRDALPGCFLADEIDVTGLFAWVLRNVRAIEQRPIKGKLGLFRVERRLIEPA
jgi:hypothetical protein